MKECTCCLSAEERKKLHEEMAKVWDKLPDNIHDMMHSLQLQKKDVLAQIKQWAVSNKEKELVRLIGLKMEKIEEKLKKYAR